jgi:hypothetical protein
MNDFQEALARFRGAMIQEGERNHSPGIQDILELERRSTGRQWQWATLMLLLLGLCAIPAYVHEQSQHGKAARERADAILSERVDAGLSRSVPRAMAPLMGSAFAKAQTPIVRIKGQGR